VFGAIAISRDGRHLAGAAAGDRTARISDFGTGLEVTVLKRHGPRSRLNGVTAAAFSADGRHLATYAFDHALRIWDVKSGAERLVISDRTHGFPSLNCLAFSPDGRHIAAGRRTSVFTNPPPGPCNVYVWDTATGAPAYELRGHTAMIWSVGFSSDGAQLVSASTDGTVRVWNCRTGDIVRVFSVEHATQAAFSADDRRVVTVAEGAVWSWSLEFGDGVMAPDGEDPQVIAGAEPQLRFRALVRAIGHGNELVIKDGATGARIAWFPTYFHKFLTHPSGLMWAGKEGVVALEDFPVNPSGANA